MTYCRLRHPPVKRELDFDADTDAASSASGDRIYAAIAALSRKIDHLSAEVATNNDVRDHVTEQLTSRSQTRSLTCASASSPWKRPGQRRTSRPRCAEAWTTL